jgi:hypothetical protein
MSANALKLFHINTNDQQSAKEQLIQRIRASHITERERERERAQIPPHKHLNKLQHSFHVIN